MAPTADSRFAQFRRTRTPALLAEVFDRTASELFRVAAHLCRGDRAAAEDALQATFLTAIERADDWDARRPLLPWLLGVLVHHVHKQRRAGARTAPLAAAGEPVAPGAGPVGDAAHGEWQTALLGALRGLPHPYREVLVLHVQHGLEAAAIAGALGRRVPCVRKQIERGLEHLRRMLPLGFALGAVVTLSAPAAAAMRAGLVAHCGRARPIHAAADAPRGPSARWRWWRPALAGGAAAVACAAAVWLPGSPPPFAAGASGQRVVAAHAVAAPALRTIDDAPRTALPLPQEPAVVRPDEVRVRVLGSDGTPVAGRMVGCVLDDVERFAATDADGRVTFARVPVPSVAQVYVVGTDVAALIEDRGFTAADRARDRTLALERGAALRVVVRDAVGRPVAGAAVESNAGMQPRRMFQPLGCTDASGELSLRDLALRGQLRAFAPGWQPAYAEFDTDADQAAALTLTLDAPAGAMTVTIVTPDGTVAPGAEVAVAPRADGNANVPFFAIADARGVATFASMPCGPFVVTATARAAGLVGWLAAEHPATGPLALTCALARGATVRGAVEDAGGQPRTSGCVSADWIPTAAGLATYPLLDRCARLDDRGRYELVGLAAGRWRVRAGACARDLEVRAGAELTWDAREPELVPLRIRLVDEAGHPLAGWRVVQRNDQGCPTGDWLTTDADGAPAAADLLWRLLPGTLQGLELHAPRPCDRDDPHDPFATMVVPPLAADDVVHVVAVPDRLRCNADVRGRLTRTDGAAPGRLRVTLCCDRSPASCLDVHCAPGDGTFHFEQLAPGRYRLAVDDGTAHCARSFALAGNEQLDLGTLDI